MGLRFFHFTEVWFPVLPTAVTISEDSVLL